MTDASHQPWALVTGASAGLGVEFARQLAAKGYDLVLTARRRDRMEKLAAEIEKDYGRKAIVLESDLAAPGAAAKLLGELATRNIEPHLLVNNAGVATHGLAVDTPLEKTMAMVQLNVMALTELALALGKKMAARGSGAIVNVSSTGSFQPIPFFAVYAATKAFVTSFSMALARELAPKGVKVLAHCPGPTSTEFNEAGGVKVADVKFVYMTAARCVKIGLRALDRGRNLIVTGFVNWVSCVFARWTPLWLVTRIAGFVMRPR